jgi:hypothetical protein
MVMFMIEIFWWVKRFGKDYSEKINFALYFPIDANIGSDRRSLYDVLTKQWKKKSGSLFW